MHMHVHRSSLIAHHQIHPAFVLLRQRLSQQPLIQNLRVNLTRRPLNHKPRNRSHLINAHGPTEAPKRRAGAVRVRTHTAHPLVGDGLRTRCNLTARDTADIAGFPRWLGHSHGRDLACTSQILCRAHRRYTPIPTNPATNQPAETAGLSL